MNNVKAQMVEQDPIESEVLEGLARVPKQISPKFFYDEKGSALFDEITELDEYYVPRIERQILTDNSADICATVGAGRTVIEPGAGSCAKIRWLLPDLAPAAYVPMDISAEHLQASAAALGEDHPELTVIPQVGDHTQGLETRQVFGHRFATAPPVFFYPGSSVGNFEPAAAAEFLAEMREQMDEAGGLLIGVDAKKDTDVLHAAYNDAAGVTAQFNINVLDNLNSLLDGDLDSSQFKHHALYNEELGRIEMHLRSTEAQSASLAGQRVEFAADELIHTESSYKYHPEEFIELAERADFAPVKHWQDDAGWYSVYYFAAA